MSATEWIFKNKEWLFSGIAISIPIALFGWIISRNLNKVIQKQKSGHSSTNIQVGGSINANDNKKETK